MNSHALAFLGHFFLLLWSVYSTRSHEQIHAIYVDRAFGPVDTSRDNYLIYQNRIKPFELYRKEDSARYGTVCAGATSLISWLPLVAFAKE
jgi:hypothetical protein